MSKRLLSLELVERIFRNLFASNLLDKQCTVVWHAGEPLVVPVDFYEQAFRIITALNTTGCNIVHAMQTNGILINQEWCDFIKSSKIQIGVSIDGPDFIHDAHRKTRAGKGTHAAVMRGIGLLEKNGIEFHVIAVITKHSLNFPDEIFHFFMKHGIKRVGFNIEEIEGANATSSLKIAETDKKYLQFMQRIYSLTKSTPGSFVVREFEHVFNFIIHGLHPTPSQQTTPFAILSIDCDGNFTTFSPEFLGMTCSMYGDFTLGNVGYDTFESVYTTPKFVQMYDDINRGVELCKNTCEYFALCGGGAPANKYFENGTLNAAETMYCRYTIKIPVDIVLNDLENMAR